MEYRIVYLLLVITGIVIFVASIFSPLLTMSELFIFSNTISIYSALFSLYKENEKLLFWIILIFAIVLPAIKYSLLVIGGLYIRANRNKSFVMLEAISKWAMLDVFVIAIIIASIKLKMLASAQTQYGLYLFVAAVLLSMICAKIQERLLYRD